MSKIKIGNRDGKTLHEKIETACEGLTKTISYLSELCEVNTDVLQDLIHEKGKTRKKLADSFDTEIEKISIVPLRDEMKSKKQYILKRFDEIVESIPGIANRSQIDKTKFILYNGKVITSESADSIVDKLTSICIEEDESIYLYNKCQELLPVLNELAAIIKEHNAWILNPGSGNALFRYKGGLERDKIELNIGFFDMYKK